MGPRLAPWKQLGVRRTFAHCCFQSLSWCFYCLSSVISWVIDVISLETKLVSSKGARGHCMLTLLNEWKCLVNEGPSDKNQTLLDKFNWMQSKSSYYLGHSWGCCGLGVVVFLLLVRFWPQLATLELVPLSYCEKAKLSGRLPESFQNLSA